MVYFFAVHPDILKKAREEILEVFGPDGTPTVENMRGLKYRESQQTLNQMLLMSFPGALQFERY